MESFYSHLILFLLVLLTCATTLARSQGTRVGFYATRCPRAESIIKSTVQSHFQSDPTIAPGLLRMHFHDCFVQGCDGSILIDGSNTEKTAPPNLPLKGYDVIDDAKAQIEAVCPGVVSCADILALAARDSVVLTNGPSWPVPTGRRDGLVSSASDTANLSAFIDSIDVQKKKFADKGLHTQDLVTLVGGHTLGMSACRFFVYRLYNFTSTGNGADPTIDSFFLPQLRALCPYKGDGSKCVDSSFLPQLRWLLDVSFFANLGKGQGILESDQRLWTDASTKKYVQGYAGLIGGVAGLKFNIEFGKSMVKMGNIGVKTGTKGEIRRVCLAFN